MIALVTLFKRFIHETVISIPRKTHLVIYELPGKRKSNRTKRRVVFLAVKLFCLENLGVGDLLACKHLLCWT